VGDARVEVALRVPDHHGGEEKGVERYTNFVYPLVYAYEH
jgi:hypothetical protein